MLDFENIDRNAAAISSAYPLGILEAVNMDTSAFVIENSRVVGFPHNALGLSFHIVDLIGLLCANPQCL